MTGHQNFDAQFLGVTKNKGSRLTTSILLLSLAIAMVQPVIAQQKAPSSAGQSPAPVIDLARTNDPARAMESRAARIVRQLSLPAARRGRQSTEPTPSLPAHPNQAPDGNAENVKSGSKASPLADTADSDPTGPRVQNATTQRAKRTEYVVKKGDTLAAIFKRHGLSARTLQRVLDADKGTARTLARLRPGQVLVLERSRAAGQLLGLTLMKNGSALARVKLGPSAPTTSKPTALREVRHRIRRGETLSSIFKRYGLSARSLQLLLDRHRDKARQLSRLRPGQHLQLELDPADRLLALRLERKDGELLTLRMVPAPAESHQDPATETAATTPAPRETTSPAIEPRQTRPAEGATTAVHPAAVESASDESEDAEPADKATIAARVEIHRIKAGETLASIFKQYGLTPGTVHQVLHAGKAARALSLIRPNQQLELAFDSEDRLASLTLVKSPVEKLVVARKGEKYRASVKKKPVEHRLASAEGVIHSSLFADGHQAGLTDAQVMELAEIFGWDIDFALEIQPGDQFRVVYEELFVDGEKYRNGPILAAEFVNRGKTYQAFRFEHDGQIGYYDAKGRSKRRAFIRTPIRFARISSRFQPRRWHPIFKKWKSHKGVDYAAPRGTPVKVTGDGRVVFRGWKRGYGRVVIVQHGEKYRTVYAHMSKFRSSVRKGTRVRQGQVIGYVGSSGWATGPHLHYEFRVNNVQRNPLTVKLPHSLPLPKRQFAAFRRQTEPLMRQLASLRAKRMVASSSD